MFRVNIVELFGQKIAESAGRWRCGHLQAIPSVTAGNEWLLQGFPPV